MGHEQAFTAVYADGGIYGISPAIGSYVFTWCRLPRQRRPCLYGAPRHISEVVLEVVVSATASRA
eukprot:6212776-Pleurochrysis_carterae.AAC.4